MSIPRGLVLSNYPRLGQLLRLDNCKHNHKSLRVISNRKLKQCGKLKDLEQQWGETQG